MIYEALSIQEHGEVKRKLKKTVRPFCVMLNIRTEQQLARTESKVHHSTQELCF